MFPIDEKYNKLELSLADYNKLYQERIKFDRLNSLDDFRRGVFGYPDVVDFNPHNPNHNNLQGRHYGDDGNDNFDDWINDELYEWIKS